MKNFAFIDGLNVHKGILSFGWELNWARFRRYLKEKYSVQKAYVLLGYIPKNQKLYIHLQEAGYILILNPVIYNVVGRARGNCDADLISQAMLEEEHFNKAVIVTSDGDFSSLVKHLYKADKLAMVLSPYIETCSTLLKKEAKEKINYMDNLKEKIAKNEKAPHADETE